MPQIEEATEWSADQQRALAFVVSGRSVCITGSAGVGKSRLVAEITARLQAQNRIVAVCGTTGMAAVGVNGRTIHKWAGVGLARESAEDLVRIVNKRRDAARAWRRTDTLLIDEVSMLMPTLFEKLEYIARKIRRDDSPFGGLQLVLVGDFAQLPPVDPSRKPGEPIYCFQTSAWERCIGVNVIELRKIFRQTDQLWINVLNKIREGTVDEEVRAALQSRHNVPLQLHQGIEPTQLRLRNADVDAINYEALAKLPDSERTYEAVFSVTDSVPYPDKIKQMLLDSVRVPEKLTLKVGAQVVLKANLAIDKGLANGSRGVVVGFVGPDQLPKVCFISGVKRIINLNVWTWENPAEGYLATFKQIPLRLAWALTVHSSQGMTLDAATIDIGINVFEAGQAYTALSRVRSLEGLSITSLNFDSIVCAHPVQKFFKKIRAAQSSPPPIKRTLDHPPDAPAKRTKHELPLQIRVLWSTEGTAQLYDAESLQAKELLSLGIRGGVYRLVSDDF